MQTKKWYTGENENFADKQTQYLTDDSDFAETYGTVYSVDLDVSLDNILDTNDHAAMMVIIDKMFLAYENGELSAEMDSIIESCDKDNLLAELTPAEVENESSYDNPDIVAYICDNTHYELIVFGAGTTALLLDVGKGSFKSF